jgi:peptidyl-tRNA hydrolase
MNTEALELLLARESGADEDPEQVRAMPVILRIERADPPGRTPLLEAAAAAALAVCLDDRSGTDGPWHDRMAAWAGFRIRKVARRARGAHWDAASRLDGVTARAGDAQVRALVPDLVSRIPHEVRRLQISGTELPGDTPEEPQPDVPVLWLNPEVPMTLGKAAAQVGHGSMLLAARLHADGGDASLAAWSGQGFRCAVRTPARDAWHDAVASGKPVPVHDAGFTEVVPGTLTVLAWS